VREEHAIPLAALLGIGGHGDEVSVRVVPWASWLLSRLKFALWPYGLFGATLYAALFAQAAARGRLPMFLVASAILLPSTLGFIWLWNSRRACSQTDGGHDLCTIVGSVKGLTEKTTNHGLATELKRHRLQLTADNGAVLWDGLSAIPLRDRDMRAVIQVTRSGRVQACEFHGAMPAVTRYAIGRLHLGTRRL
jgi:hypothetical protein